MSWLDDYPYTNFHEWNLDWVLTKMRELLTSWTEYKQEMNLKYDMLDEELADLREYVADYFKNLDVQDEINNKIDQMSDDGSLAAILEHISSIDGQTLAVTNTAIDNYNKVDDGKWLQVQGMCINDAAQTMVYAIIPTFDDANNEPISKLIKRSVNNYNLLQSVSLPIYHANSMTYNNAKNEIYITKGPYRNEAGESVSSNTIFIVDYDTLEIKETRNIVDEIGNPVVVHGIAYDTGTGETWVYQGQNGLWKLDIDTWIATYHYEVPYPTPQAAVHQDIIVRDGFLYSLFHAPDMLYCYAIYPTKAVLVKAYTIPYWIGGYLFTGETESLDFYGDDIIFSCFNWDTTRYDHSEILFNKCNPRQNVLNGLFANWWSVTSSVTHSIYVDSNSSVLVETGEKTAPFKTLQNAINMFRNGNQYKVLNIYIAEGEYDYSILNNITSYVRISAWDSGRKPTINGLHCYGVQALTLENLIIRKQANSTRALGVYYTPKVEINNCDFTSDSDAPETVLLSYSEAYVSGARCFGGQYGFRLTRGRLHGIPSYSENPTHRVIAGVYSTWYTSTGSYNLERLATNQEFTTTADTSNTHPTTTPLYNGSVNTGTITLPDNRFNRFNCLVISAQLGGKRQTFNIFMTGDNDQSHTINMLEVGSSSYRIAELTFKFNKAQRTITINSNNSFNGSTYGTNAINIVSVYGMTI